MARRYEYEDRVEITGIVDADTLKIRVDLGFSIWHQMTVRLLGLNAPEMSTAEGKVAKTWVGQWILIHPGPYTARTVKDQGDKYGRILASIAAADGASLNGDLLAGGYAQPYDGGPR